VRTLLVGESPPANGTFFYCGNSNLSRYTAEAFASIYGPYPSAQAFLTDFGDRGFYLVDLCPNPVNHLTRPERRSAHRAAIPVLAASLRELRPARLIVVVKAIEDAVLLARDRAGLTALPVTALPFPAQGNQGNYVQQLISVLKGEGTRQWGW
jgi:hypothetical protein